MISQRWVADVLVRLQEAAQLVGRMTDMASERCFEVRVASLLRPVQVHSTGSAVVASVGSNFTRRQIQAQSRAKDARATRGRSFEFFDLFFDFVED